MYHTKNRKVIFTKQNLFLDVGLDKIEDKYKKEETKTKCYKTSHYVVAKENQKKIKRKEGDYFVIEFAYESLHTKTKELIKEVERVMKTFFKKYKKVEKVLIIGLGNKDVDGDALGVSTTDKLIATNQYQDFLTIPKIALFNPSVTNKTGINTFHLIEMVVKDLKPDLLIMIDSLATHNESYLNQAIEINDTGIIPGSAINSAKEINQKTFNIPVLSIGVPSTLEYNKQFYTSVYIHEVIEKSSFILASAINNLFIKHP